MSNVPEFTDDNFETEVLQSDVPVLVDFWAPWCAPCRQIAPVIDELATEYAGRVKVGKVNVDNNQAVAQKYDVMSIPTLIIFKNGEDVNRIVGVQPKSRLQSALEAVQG